LDVELLLSKRRRADCDVLQPFGASRRGDDDLLQGGSAGGCIAVGSQGGIEKHCLPHDPKAKRHRGYPQ